MASSSPRGGADDNPHERQRAAEAADALALLSDRGFDPMQGEEFEELRGELQRAHLLGMRLALREYNNDQESRPRSDDRKPASSTPANHLGKLLRLRALPTAALLRVPLRTRNGLEAPADPR